jgi:hypothetical protein
VCEGDGGGKKCGYWCFFAFLGGFTRFARVKKGLDLVRRLTVFFCFSILFLGLVVVLLVRLFVDGGGVAAVVFRGLPRLALGGGVIVASFLRGRPRLANGGVGNGVCWAALGFRSLCCGFCVGIG